MSVPTTGFVPATGHDGFRNDKYYRYTATSVTVMAGWPRMLAWQRSAKVPAWRMLRPECGKPSLATPTACGAICSASLSHERSAHCQRGEGDCVAMHGAWLRWSQLIPQDVREVVCQFPTRHWHLLSLAARCGEPALDLMRSNPALAWALASSWVFRANPVQEPMRAVRRLLAPGKSQRDVLAWLDFPHADAARRTLRKLVIPSISVNTLLALRDAMRDPASMKMLGHLPRLNCGAVKLVTDAELRPFVSHALLVDVVRTGRQHLVNYSPDRSEENFARAAMQIHDCLRMVDFAGLERRSFAPVRSLAELEERHHALLLRQQNAGLLLSRAPLELPPPPFAGTADIIPLTTERALVEEGMAMKHCVGSYGTDVSKGIYAVYQVMAPARATLAIQRVGNRWNIAEMKGMANQEPSPECWRAVQEWLRLQQRD